jgi:hypothetical protein
MRCESRPGSDIDGFDDTRYEVYVKWTRPLFRASHQSQLDSRLVSRSDTS